MYSCVTWFMIRKDEELFTAWERNILKKVYGPVLTKQAWGIRYSQELRELYKPPDLVLHIKQKTMQ
jgi:hypothetical protein